MRFSTVTALAFAGMAAAREMSLMERQLQTITNVLNNVQSQVQQLDQAINAYNGGDPTAVLDGSKKVIDSTNTGTNEVNAATAISIQDAVQVQRIVQDLQKTVDKTITDLVAKKDKAKAANLGGEAYKQLQAQYEGAKAVSGAISSKVPPSLAVVATNLSGQILASIQKGITAFEDIKGQVYSGPGASSAGAAAGGAAAGGNARVSNTAAAATPTASSGSSTSSTAASTSSKAAAVGAFKPVGGLSFAAAVLAIFAF